MRVGRRGGRPAALGHEPPLGRPQLWVGQKSKGDGGGEDFFFFFFFFANGLAAACGPAESVGFDGSDLAAWAESRDLSKFECRNEIRKICFGS